MPIDDARRFDGVKIIGVDEHVWRLTMHENKYVTVIVDLTTVRDKTNPSRLLAWFRAVPNRSSLPG